MNPSYQSEVGRVLRDAREDLRLSLPEASTALHIRAHYLQALETGDLSVLPGSAYTKGYLQSYASFLHLDKNEIMRRLERVEDDLPQRSLFFPQVFSNEKKPPNSLIWGGIIVAVLVYLLWFIVYGPEKTTINGLIDQPPPIVEVFKEYNLPKSVFNLSCTTSAVKLYPACYRQNPDIVRGDFKLLGNRRIVSVMELKKI